MRSFCIQIAVVLVALIAGQLAVGFEQVFCLSLPMSTAIYWNFALEWNITKTPLTPLSPCRKLGDGWRDSDNSDTRLLSSLLRILATHTDPHQDIIWGHRRLLSLSSFRANSTINIKFYSCLTGSMKSMQFCSHFPLFSGQHHRCGHLR